MTIFRSAMFRILVIVAILAFMLSCTSIDTEEREKDEALFYKNCTMYLDKAGQAECYYFRRHNPRF